MKRKRATRWNVKVWLPLLLTGLFFTAGAQSVKPGDSCKITFKVAYQLLYSTHGTVFHGLSAEAIRPITRRLYLGFGAGYSSTPSHPDNDWDLTYLRFLSLYFDNVLKFGKGLKRSGAYLHASEGYSFCRYNKRDPAISPNFFKVREGGFYFYMAPGVSYKITARSAVFLELGYKGFKNSFNNLDVNPHGTNMKIGLSF
jgi:hypothetical protein